jgi:hypothetical protein
VVKHVDAVELRVVVVAALAVAADAVHVHDLARRRSPEARSTRQRKGGEERSNVRNSVWQFFLGGCFVLTTPNEIFVGVRAKRTG